MSENVSSAAAVTVTRTVDASPERVFDKWLDPTAIEAWRFPAETDAVVDVDVEPRVGGRFSFVVRRGDDEIDHVVRYLEIDRPTRLAFTWGTADDAGEDRVSVAFDPAPTGCEVTLTHELHRDWMDFADRTERAWTSMLDSLAEYLLSADARQPTDRPMRQPSKSARRA